MLSVNGEFILYFFYYCDLFLSAQCRYRRLLLRLVIFNDTHTHLHTKYYSSERVISSSQILLRTQHTTRDTTQEKNTHASERDLNPQSPQGPQANHEVTGMGLSVLSNCSVQ